MKKIIDQLLEKFGSYEKIAAEYGKCDKSQIWNWHKKGKQKDLFIDFQKWSQKALKKSPKKFLDDL